MVHICVVCVYHRSRNTIYSYFYSLNKCLLATHSAMPFARCPCNGVPPLLSGSSQVMGEMSMQIIPAGLAQYFTRNTPTVQYKLSRRAITLEGEFRKSFSEERTSWMFWIMSRRQCGGRQRQRPCLDWCLCFALLGWITGLGRSPEGPGHAGP